MGRDYGIYRGHFGVGPKNSVMLEAEAPELLPPSKLTRDNITAAWGT